MHRYGTTFILTLPIPTSPPLSVWKCAIETMTLQGATQCCIIPRPQVYNEQHMLLSLDWNVKQHSNEADSNPKTYSFVCALVRGLPPK